MSEIFKGGVLVIGGSGYIGETTVASLKGDGEEVIAVSKTERPNDPLKGFGIERMDTTCLENVIEIFSKYQPEYIFDYSGWSKPNDSKSDPEGARKVMVESLENLFKAIACVQKTNNVYRPKQIVIAGSVAALGPGRLDENGKCVALDENSGWQPNSVYGELKAEASDLALKLGQDYGINVIVSIQANAGGVSKYYGISQRPGFIVPDNIEKIIKIMKGDGDSYNLNGVPILKTGPTNQYINMTSVDEMVEAYKKLGKSSSHTKVVVGASESTQVSQIIEWMIRASGMKIEHKSSEEVLPSQFYDVRKLNKMIGFVPKPINEKDIAFAVNEYKKRYGIK